MYFIYKNVKQSLYKRTPAAPNGDTPAVYLCPNRTAKSRCMHMAPDPHPEGRDRAICETHNNGTKNIEDDEADHSDDSSYHCGSYHQENEQGLHVHQLQYGEWSSFGTVRGRASSYHRSVCRSTTSLESDGEFHTSEKERRGASLTITTP